MREANLFIISILILLALCTFGTTQSISKEIEREESWMGIYSDDKRVGYSYNSIEKEGDLTKVFELTKMKVNLIGKETDVITEGSYTLEGYKILSFNYEMNSDRINLKASGTRKGDKLNITMETLSGKTERTLTINQELIVPSLVPRLIAENSFKTGDKYKFVLFEPLSLLMGIDEPLSTHQIGNEETIELKNNKYKTYRIDSDFMGSEITSWINDSGEVIKQTFPPELTSIRETKDEILNAENKSFDVVQGTAIRTNKKLKNSEKLKSMKVKLYGTELDQSFNINDGYRQNLDGQTLKIKSQELEDINNSYELPYSLDDYSQYTKSDFLIQSQDEDIVKATEKVLDGEIDPKTATNKINNWIFKTLKKTPTASLPNAKDVLQMKEGDCNEHAVLFTAMARSAGIPTKTVLGLMYIDGSFVYHAWNEVYIGKWVAVDSTFGQFPADATHIKLIEGNLAKSAEISKVVGKLKIDIIDAF